MIERIFRVVHGGSWYNFPVILHAAFRGLFHIYITPTTRDSNLGFRLVVRIKDE